MQEALLRAWRGRRSCRTPEAPLAWCLQITRNEAIRLISGRRRLPPVEPLDPEHGPEDARANAEADTALERVLIAKALQELTQDERRLISLRYDVGCSHPQIAAVLAIPEATARVRLHRLRKRLQKLLESQGYAEAA